MKSIDEMSMEELEAEADKANELTDRVIGLVQAVFERTNKPMTERELWTVLFEALGENIDPTIISFACEYLEFWEESLVQIGDGYWRMK